MVKKELLLLSPCNTNPGQLYYTLIIFNVLNRILGLHTDRLYTLYLFFVADIHCLTISTVKMGLYQNIFQQGLSTNNKVNSLLNGTEGSGSESLRFLLTRPVNIKHSTHVKDYTCCCSALRNLLHK